ncbi:hypothetical protein [Fibrivirga algicola]|uniref:Uncharacterized protein n=1 Tax=Fibrivirga algicola TaxID=2950420 RepID=A0ABX0QLY3_9BACT|nr:hypothetical protein [Fibrivirga algicola]NID13495.1 hypothetical protein [Fibrivirga algicola]
MKKKTKFSDKEYHYLLTGLSEQITKVPKLKPNRDEWDIEGNWQECGDIHFVDSKYMAEFATWRDFGCKTVKMINYGRPAVRMSFFSKHKYWLKKPHDLTEEERDEHINDYLNGLSLSINQLQNKIDHLPPLAQAESRRKIYDAQQEIEAWQQVQQQSAQYELAVSTYQRGYAYLYISYKYLLPTGEYDNASEHLLHHIRDRVGNITQSKQNVIFVNMAEINRVHPQQNKEIENYLNRFSLKSTSGPKWLYARPRPELESQAAFGVLTPTNDQAQLDLFDEF